MLSSVLAIRSRRQGFHYQQAQGLRMAESIDHDLQQLDRHEAQIPLVGDG